MPTALLAALLCAAAPAGPAALSELPSLPLDALVSDGPAGPGPSPRARALHGRRVRLAGHMARLEVAPDGAFFLTAVPVACDEAGGGTADLPPGAVRVGVRSAVGAPVRWLPGRLEVTGRLEVGPRTDAAGRTAHFTLLLDRPEDLGPAATP
ncbi:MAG: hypothetical protein NDI82_02140 [Anaeromyxobacteraceae bacterium]|nr:hypothetical protein [Anaeromyxobacteraceae bacterium]